MIKMQIPTENLIAGKHQFLVKFTSHYPLLIACFQNAKRGQADQSH